MKFSIEKSNAFVKFTTALLKPANINIAIKKVSELDTVSLKHIVFDLRSIEAAAQNSLPFFCKAASIFNQEKLKFSIISNKTFSDLLKKNDMYTLFNVFSNEDEFYDWIRPMSRRETVSKFVDTMVSSAIHSLHVSLEVEIKNEGLRIIRPDEKIPSIQVGASAGVFSDQFNGNLSLCFSESVFLKVMSAFLQFDIDEITPDIRDGGAELLNVIIGQTKMKLNDNGFNIKQVLPTVMTGEEIDFSPGTNQVSMIVPLTCDLGDFFIAIQTLDSEILNLKTAA